MLPDQIQNAARERIERFCESLLSASFLPVGGAGLLPNGQPVGGELGAAWTVAARFGGAVARAQSGGTVPASYPLALAGPASRYVVDWRVLAEEGPEAYILDTTQPRDCARIALLYGPPERWERTAAGACAMAVYHARVPGQHREYFDAADFVRVGIVVGTRLQLAVEAASAAPRLPRLWADPIRNRPPSSGAARLTGPGDIIERGGLTYLVLGEGGFRLVPARRVFDLRRLHPSREPANGA